MQFGRFDCRRRCDRERMMRLVGRIVGGAGCRMDDGKENDSDVEDEWLGVWGRS